MDSYYKLIQKSKFTFNSKISTSYILKKQKHELIQTGIGDILYNGLLLKNKLINFPLYINISTFINNPYRLNNPLQNFTFTVDLLNLLYDKNEIVFFYDSNLIIYTRWEDKLIGVKDNLILQKKFNFVNLFNKEYIVFHTKCRFSSNFNYDELKDNIYNFCKNFKTKYQIIIWGERIMPSNLETDEHKITTIYEELKQLNNNNEVIDLTEENIYDNLNIENYLKLLNVYNKSKLNIFCGVSGGNLASCICFSKNSICFNSTNILDYVLNNYNISNTIKICKTYIDFFSSIENICNN
jgi:hypothetical protein